MTFFLSLTPVARDEILNIKAAQSLPAATGIRVGILGGGCSGMQYALSLESEVQADRDFVEMFDGIPLITERKFAPHLEGTVIDFQQTPYSQGFHVDNPNFPRGSGCAGCGG